MNNSFRNDVYRSSKTLSYVAMGLLGSLIFCYVLNIIFSFGHIMFSDRTIDLDDGESASVAFVLIGLVSLLHIPLFLATIVFFLIWLHRAFNNLSALRAGNLEFSPGWAVGWWFVPFANLVKPYQVMSELWNESDPDFDPDGSFLSSAVGAPPLVGWWWALFIVSNILLQVADKMSGSTVSDIGASFAVVLIIASLLRAVDGFLIIKIIRSITQRQELRLQRIGELTNFNAPPPPPNFGQNDLK